MQTAIDWQERAHRYTQYAMANREQAKQAERDGFSKEDWLMDAWYYQEVAAEASERARQMMGVA